jgi:hypothetical protein
LLVIWTGTFQMKSERASSCILHPAPSVVPSWPTSGSFSVGSEGDDSRSCYPRRLLRR